MNYIRMVVSGHTEDDGPGVCELVDGYDVESEQSVTKIRQYQDVPFAPNFELVMVPEHHRKDVYRLSFINSTGLLVSERIYQVLSACRLPDCQIFEATIYQEHKAHTYRFIHFLSEFDKREGRYVDFNRTVFLSRNTEPPLCYMSLVSEQGILGDFSVNSWKDFWDIRGATENDYSLKHIQPHILYLDKKPDVSIFFPDFGNFNDPHYLIDEALHQALVVEKPVGLTFVKPPYGIEVN